MISLSHQSLEPSYYEASVTRPVPQPPLQGEVNADVCVIGGGLTGISCALELVRQGRDVVLLESQVVGWGASGRNGGQMIHGYATDQLTAIARLAGVSEKQLFDFSVQALAQIRQRVDEFAIDCDWQMGYATAAVKSRHFRDLQAYATTLERDYDYPHVRVLNAYRFREIVASRRYCGGLTDSNSGHLHPLKYVLGLCHAALAAGTRLFENSAVIRLLHPNQNTVQVVTATGMVRCRCVVLAANAYGQGLFPAISRQVMPVATYIGATVPLGDIADHLLAGNISVCDSNFVLDYFRCSADKRLLFGGRVSYSTKSFVDLRQSLHRRMWAVFPQLSDYSFDYVWGGNVAITINRFPDIGRQGKAVYYAQGFSGHGVALSGFAGKIIADAVVGDSEKFDVFNRIQHRPFPGGKHLRMPLLVLAMLYYRLRDIL